MASLNIPQNSKAVKGRTKKIAPGVDLTAMVDLAFLLITFFMLTTSLSKYYAMDVVKPVPVTKIIDTHDWPGSRTMTILLGKDNKAAYYMGEAENAAMKIADLSIIKNQIVLNKQFVSNSHAKASDKRMLVIIKPTATSVYKNFVDVIDEMKINGIETYAIDDKYILDKEINFMKSKGI